MKTTETIELSVKKPSKLLLIWATIKDFLKTVCTRTRKTWTALPNGFRHSFLGALCASALVAFVLYISLVEFMTLILTKLAFILLFNEAG